MFNCYRLPEQLQVGDAWVTGLAGGELMLLRAKSPPRKWPTNPTYYAVDVESNQFAGVHEHLIHQNDPVILVREDK